MIRILTEGDYEIARKMSADGCSVAEIADALMLSLMEFKYLRKTNRDLDRALTEWKYEADEAIERALYKKALGGDVNAARLWLQQRKPEDWNRKPKQETGDTSTVFVKGGVPKKKSKKDTEADESESIKLLTYEDE